MSTIRALREMLGLPAFVEALEESDMSDQSESKAICATGLVDLADQLCARAKDDGVGCFVVLAHGGSSMVSISNVSTQQLPYLLALVEDAIQRHLGDL